MNSITIDQNQTSKIDRKVVLSTLWIFAILNYLYADVLGLFDQKILKDVLNGTGPVQMTQGFMLGAAVLMETAIVMVILSRFLNYKANRIANIISGFIHTLAVILSLFAGKPAYYYLFFGSIEIACTVFIIWYSWTWPRPHNN